MKEDILIPSLGESVTEGTISAWLKKDGDFVNDGDPLFELESDKATLEVPSTVSGQLKTLVEEGTDVEIGQVVAEIDTSVKKPAEEKAAENTKTQKKKETGESSNAEEERTSPGARRAMEEHGVTAEEITPTGKSGTIVKEDVLNKVDAEKSAKKKVVGIDRAEKDRPEKECGQEKEQVQERKKMSRIRQRIAENLVESKQQSAHLTTFNEINMKEVLELRKKFQDQFVKAHGTKLGILSFFIKASCLALKKYPEANSFVEGNEIIYNRFYNIGFAVSIDRGLVVPVIKNADALSIDEIEEAVSDLAAQAREKHLSVDEMTGGTFSITNGGVFGSLLSTPIPTPPQSAILGMHTIQERPVAENGEVVIRPMMYVALTYDHRIMDGKEAVGFLKSVKEAVEEPEKLLLNI